MLLFQFASASVVISIHWHIFQYSMMSLFKRHTIISAFSNKASTLTLKGIKIKL